MARTYNKPGSAKAAAPKTAETPAEKTEARPAAPAVKKAAAPVKQEAPAKSVIAAPDKEVIKKIVYQPSAQILTREADPSETFGVGDDMPIYYL
ncbi:MAG: hypothetical protein IJT24_08170 [Lachnospiraceae bacterium]|nr:hypothetical protein [Lachnospiraceae bacterium]